MSDPEMQAAFVTFLRLENLGQGTKTAVMVCPSRPLLEAFRAAWGRLADAIAGPDTLEKTNDLASEVKTLIGRVLQGKSIETFVKRSRN